jgi:hypothetical protein
MILKRVSDEQTHPSVEGGLGDSTSECGSIRNSPGGLGNMGKDSAGDPLPLKQLQKLFGEATAHVRMVLAFTRIVPEMAPAIDHLLRRAAAPTMSCSGTNQLAIMTR